MTSKGKVIPMDNDQDKGKTHWQVAGNNKPMRFRVLWCNHKLKQINYII